MTVSVSRSLPVIDVTQAPYNARGDGATDDLAAINRATAALNAAGGGTVFFPDGTYLIDPGSTASGLWIKLYDNVTLAGTGRGSCIKVKGDAGNYVSMISAATFGASVTGATIRDLCLDQNAAGNTTSTIATGSDDTALRVIYLTDFSNVRVERCVIKYVGVNGLMLNGDGNAASDAVVAGNRFEFERGATAVTDYDNSAVYCVAREARITDNVFAADIAELARGAMEIHCPIATIKGNTVRNYEAGVYVVSESSVGDSLDASGISITGNTFHAVCFGIAAGALSGFTLRDVTIAGNSIYVDQISHDRSYFAGITTFWGTPYVGTIEGLTIAGNTIRFAYEEAAGRTQTAGAVALNAASSGIRVAAHTGTTLLGFAVTGNTIIAAPSSGIGLGQGSGTGTLQGGVIANNAIVNAGQNVGFNADNRAGIFTSPAVFVNVLVRGNTITDAGRSAGDSYGRRSIETQTITGSRNFWVVENIIDDPEGDLITAIDANGGTWTCTGEGSASLNFPNIVAAGGAQSLTVTVRGARVNDHVTVTPRAALNQGLVPYAYVSAADTVTVRATNVTAADIDPGSVTYDVAVRRRQDR